MPNVTSTSNSTTQMPSWLTAALQQLVQSAQTTASNPYATYPNQRIAGLTPDQIQAQNLTQQNVGNYQPAFNQAGTDYSNATGAVNSAGQSYQPYFGQAGSAYNQGMGQIQQGNAAYQGAYNQAGQDYGYGNNPNLNSSVFNSYMNPYQSNVVNQIATLGNRNLTENVLPAVNSTFTGAGQFGSSRNADFTNRALRDNQTAISQAQGQALASGFQNQVGNTQAGIGQTLQAGQLEQGLGTARQQAGITGGAALAGIGQQQQGLGAAYQQAGLDTAGALTNIGQQQQGLGAATQAAGLTDTAALTAVGQQQQNQNQQNLNLGYQDFLTQQQWPYQQESYLAGILGGTPSPTSTTQTNTTPGPNTTSQILGGLAGGIGLLGSTGAFGSGGWLGDLGSTVGSWFAEGGPVKKAGGGRAKRPRFGGVATKRMGGIGMQPGGGVSGILPGAPAAAAQRLPSNLSPGTASILRGLSGGASPSARMV